MTQSCSFQNLHVIKQFYSFTYLYVLVWTNQKTFCVRSPGRFDVRSRGKSHKRPHKRSPTRDLTRDLTGDWHQHKHKNSKPKHSALTLQYAEHTRSTKMKCLHGEPCAQSTTNSAVKTRAVTSFAHTTKATHMKKPSTLGNLQNSHNLAAKNTVNSRKYESSKTCWKPTTVDPSSCVPSKQILVPSGLGATYRP